MSGTCKQHFCPLLSRGPIHVASLLQENLHLMEVCHCSLGSGCSLHCNGACQCQLPCFSADSRNYLLPEMVNALPLPSSCLPLLCYYSKCCWPQLQGLGCGNLTAACCRMTCKRWRAATALGRRRR